MSDDNVVMRAIVCAVALAIAAAVCVMDCRACTRCFPQRGKWDPLRGELCYGEEAKP